MTKVLLIDVENCPSQIDSLLSSLEKYSQVIICYAKSGSKIPIDWILPLTKSIENNALKIIKMSEIRKNSADFGITFWAGVLMAQLPEDTHFDIVSNDSDLDILVDLLTSQLRDAKRIGIKKNPILAEEQATSTIPINTAVFEYCNHLVSYTNHPAKESTLLNSIKSKFKLTIAAEKVYAELIKQGIVKCYEDKITYNMPKIKTLIYKNNS